VAQTNTGSLGTSLTSRSMSGREYMVIGTGAWYCGRRGVVSVVVGTLASVHGESAFTLLSLIPMG
jgi:hypothetical protein